MRVVFAANRHHCHHAQHAIAALLVADAAHLAKSSAALRAASASCASEQCSSFAASSCADNSSRWRSSAASACRAHQRVSHSSLDQARCNLAGVWAAAYTYRLLKLSTPSWQPKLVVKHHAAQTPHLVHVGSLLPCCCKCLILCSQLGLSVAQRQFTAAQLS